MKLNVLMLARLPGVLDEWRAGARRHEGVTVLGPKDAFDPAEVDAAVVWSPPRGWLRRYPNLRLICSLGAGVEHLSSDPELPDVPIVKLMSAAKQRLMNEWVMYAVLRFHRGFDRFEQLQRQARWETPGPGPLAEHTRVTVLGLGDLGQAAATMLSQHGFAVTGWSRTPRAVPGVRCLHGAEGLDTALAHAHILVCLLALTPATEGLLNAALFARLPRGAAIVNVGRGRHLAEADLLAALDSGHLRGAMLDVAEPEPLPPGHPFWHHPAIVLTPHVAAYMPHHAALDSLLATWHDVLAGVPLAHRVDLRRGY